MKNPSSRHTSSTRTRYTHTLLQLAPLIRSFLPPPNTHNQNHWYETFKKINAKFTNIPAITFPAMQILNAENKQNKKQLHEIFTILTALSIAYLIHEKDNETFNLDHPAKPTV